MNTEALRDIISTETGLTTVWFHPNAPRPSRPYATTQIISQNDVGQFYRAKPDSNGIINIQIQREITLNVNVYESTDSLDPRAAFNHLVTLKNAFNKPSVIATLSANDWGIRAIELMADNTAIIDEKWEPRATFDIRLGTTVTVTDDVGIIESVDLNGQTIP